MQGKARGRSKFVVIATLSVAVVASIAAEYFFATVKVAENWSRDLRVATLTPPEPQSEQIVIVTITEDTLSAFPYRSPLDRKFLSVLLRTLEQKGATLIGLDLLLDQPSELDKDVLLQDTLRNISVPVVAASAEVSDGLTERQVAFMKHYLNGVRKGVPMLLADPIDGKVRAVMLRRQYEGRTQLGFIAALADALGINVPAGRLLTLHYRGSPDETTPAFAMYPAHAASRLPDAWFKGRIVLIGADLDLADRHSTPFSVIAAQGSGNLPGVLLQAHALSQILEGRVGPRSLMWQSILATVVAASIGAGIVMSGIPLAVSTIALLIAASAIWVGGFATFQYTGQLLPLMAPTLALALAAGFTYAWRWRDEQIQRRFIRNAFSKFVAPALVNQMVKEPERLRLGGERRNLTFLFTDLSDYTKLTENTGPKLLVKMMNEYLEGTCNIVLEHGGTIEKIVGDALHVMFNAPLEQPDHPDRAITCALALDDYCQSFSARQRSRGINFGVTRIGVNTGVAIVGNFGGEKRFDYTATGDAINTAARLEGVNKHLGTRICVSGTTVEKCHNADFRPVGQLMLKGKSEYIAAFEPVPNGDKKHSGLEGYMAAYELMSAGDFEAKAAFCRLAEQHPGDALVNFHLKRLLSGESKNLIVFEEK